MQLKLFLTFFVTFLMQANASIICKTPRESKILKIHKNSVSFPHLEENENLLERGTASLPLIRTKHHGRGFTKILFLKGIKHTIHIKDKLKFSEVEDYLILKSQEGHEMTLPLKCQSS